MTMRTSDAARIAGRLAPQRAGAAALLLLAGAVALAAALNVDAARSQVTATFRQENVPVDAKFTRFGGSIVYDAAHPEVSSAALDVETASFDMGDESYNSEVRGKAWFDSAGFPKATFRSTSIKARDATHFDATGQLTIKGKALTITVPVALQAAAKGRSYAGTFTLSRVAFGIGDPSWKDVLDDKVVVRFSLVTP
jgi:polyisoprenoid-binding protein YceI